MGYYAWTNFPVERDEWGKTTKVIKPGDSVSQSDLGVSDEEWADLVEVNAVSEEEYPDIPDHQSPAEYLRDKTAADAEAADARAYLAEYDAENPQVEEPSKPAAPATKPAATPTSTSN